MRAKNIIFVTGTGTGVGKTLLTASLLHHLRQAGVQALAMKPFCSGGLADVRLLQSLQCGELPDRAANPYYFPEPVAPLVAAKKNRPAIRLAGVVEKIKRVEAKCDCLLIEGSGGVLVPLGPGFTVADLIAALDCRVIVAGINQLGTINHTLLTIHALRAIGVADRDLSVALMSCAHPDLSARTNPGLLANFLKPVPVISIPFLGSRAISLKAIRRNGPKIAQTLNLLV